MSKAVYPWYRFKKGTFFSIVKNALVSIASQWSSIDHWPSIDHWLFPVSPCCDLCCCCCCWRILGVPGPSSADPPVLRQSKSSTSPLSSKASPEPCCRDNARTVLGAGACYGEFGCQTDRRHSLVAGLGRHTTWASVR